MTPNPELDKAISRFKKNRPGMAGFLFIMLTVLIAFFAYAIAPDNTVNANTMHLSLSNKPPGFSIGLIEVSDSVSKNAFTAFFTGKKPLQASIPVESYRIENDSIRYREYLGEGTSPAEKSMEYSAYTKIEKTRFLLGTDRYGRDLLSRIVVGSRVSLTIGLVAVLISLAIGVLVGAVSGYFGGKADSVSMWAINIVWAIPTALMVIAISLVLGRGIWQVYVAVGLTMWVELARVVRGQFIAAKRLQYVEAARALGFGNFRIIFRHILPNLWGVIVVICAANFASAILVESGLSFLGLGAQPPLPSWGGIIRDHYAYMMMGKPYLALVPGIAIMLLVLSFICVGNALRDALDVKKGA